MAQTQPQRINVPRVTVNGPPTAWESIPKLIRFVAWVVAILTRADLPGRRTSVRPGLPSSSSAQASEQRQWPGNLPDSKHRATL